MIEATKEQLEELFPHVEVLEVPRPEEDKAAWLEHRKKGIGGSDVAGILGLSPWTSPHSVWGDKLGLFDDEEDSAGLPAEIGTELEPMLVRKFEEDTGLVVLTTPGFMLRDREETWALANVDGLAFKGHVSRETFKGILEGKTSNMPDHWEDGVPLHYQTQGQHYAAILRAPRIYYPHILWFYSGPKFDILGLEFDQEDADAIRNQCRTFWEDCILGQEPPPMLSSTRARDALARWLEHHKDEDVQLGTPELALVEEFERVNDAIKAAEEEKERLSVALIEAIGDANRGHLPDGRRANSIRRGYFDEKAARETNAELLEKYKTTETKLDTKALKKDHPKFYEEHRKRSSAYIRIYGKAKTA